LISKKPNPYLVLVNSQSLIYLCKTKGVLRAIKGKISANPTCLLTLKVIGEYYKNGMFLFFQTKV